MTLNFHRKLRHCGTILLGPFAFGATTPAIADPISYNFDGSLAYAGNSGKPIDNASWQFKEGQKFRGTLVYDVDAITSSGYAEEGEVGAVNYYSPIVSMSFEIDFPNGRYGINVPVGNSAAYIVANPRDHAPEYGVVVDMSFYYPDGTLIAPISESAKVGNWTPHSVDLELVGTYPVISSSTDPNINLVNIFNGIPEISDRTFSVYFLDSDGKYAGAIGGRIENFALQSAVPEPEVWTMLIIGFGAIGASLRWRGFHRATLRSQPSPQRKPKSRATRSSYSASDPSFRRDGIGSNTRSCRSTKAAPSARCALPCSPFPTPAPRPTTAPATPSSSG